MSVVSLPARILFHLTTKENAVLINPEFSFAQSISGKYFEVRDLAGEVCISGDFGKCWEQMQDYYFYRDLESSIIRLCQKHLYA
jgi:hypothetical protein